MGYERREKCVRIAAKGIPASSKATDAFLFDYVECRLSVREKTRRVALLFNYTERCLLYNSGMSDKQTGYRQVRFLL